MKLSISLSYCSGTNFVLYKLSKFHTLHSLLLKEHETMAIKRQNLRVGTLITVGGVKFILIN